LTPRITVGLPVYKGADLIGEALQCLQEQTFSNFEAIISVDGNDLESAEASRPFLVDPRFRMVVHSERLDWVGNFNWLLQQDLREFFCYRQHDDTTAPEFFEVLLRVADRDLKAAATYCDCQFRGVSNDLEVARTIQGETMDRMLRYLEYMPTAVPVRGLIRREAIRHAGLVRSDEFRAAKEVFVWLAKLLRWGNFRRVAKPLYYKLDHPDTFSRQYEGTREDYKRAVLTTLFTGLLEATMPLCRTVEERQFFQQTIVDQIVVYSTGNDPDASQILMTECLQRLNYEGNTHLLTEKELPAIIQGLQLRRHIERSPIRKVSYRVRREAQLAMFIYPTCWWRRALFQVRRVLERIGGKVKRLL
jgi:hypothetical protein